MPGPHPFDPTPGPLHGNPLGSDPGIGRELTRRLRHGLFLTAVITGASAPQTQTAAAQEATLPPAEVLQVPGLDRPVEILRDHWGIPHI